jgi:hypothetical protein
MREMRKILFVFLTGCSCIGKQEVKKEYIINPPYIVKQLPDPDDFPVVTPPIYVLPPTMQNNTIPPISQPKAPAAQPVPSDSVEFRKLPKMPQLEAPPVPKIIVYENRLGIDGPKIKQIQHEFKVQLTERSPYANQPDIFCEMAWKW